MDSTIIDLATKVMAILLPFVTKSTEEFASKMGEGAYEKTKTLLASLKQKWSGDQEATETLERFETKPERYKPVLEDILQEKLARDQDLAWQVAQLIQEISPALDIVQRMEEGKDIIGLKAKEMKRGKVRVLQEITSAEGVTGAEFDALG